MRSRNPSGGRLPLLLNVDTRTYPAADHRPLASGLPELPPRELKMRYAVDAASDNTATRPVGRCFWLRWNAWFRGRRCAASNLPFTHPLEGALVVHQIDGDKCYCGTRCIMI